MADTPYAAQQTRPHWAGNLADIDIHLEAFEGLVDGHIRVRSMFMQYGWTLQRNIHGQSNTWRGDRMGGGDVSTRKSGEALVPTRIVNDKFLVTADLTTYKRTPIDYQDIWTAPDRQAEIAAVHSTAMAKQYDVAHVTQLIKAGNWIAPAELKASGAFNDGITQVMTGYGAAANDKARADIIVAEHKKALNEFVNRDLGDSLTEFVTLMKPEAFSALLDHDKLMNVQFTAGVGGNNFVQRRIGTLNGSPVIETPRIPKAAGNPTGLGPNFEITAAEARTQMIIFHPGMTLVTVEAQPLTSKFWADDLNFQNVLDSYRMYTVGVRRGDGVAVLRSDA